MANIGFNEDIRPIFAPFVGCMRHITISTPEGVFPVELDKFESVRRLHEFILIAIRGWDPATPSAHRMPPREALPAASIRAFAQWIADGMPETRSA